MHPSEEVAYPFKVAVGYMLKVLKSGIDTSKYRQEFAAIRHGNYEEFIDLVKGRIPFMVIYGQEEGERLFDFAGLFVAGPSLAKFANQCFLEYGKIPDQDVSTEVYQNVAYFEAAIRMHANNRKLLGEKEDFIHVINKLGESMSLPQDEIDKLQQGRMFLNMIKHFKNQFPSWEEGNAAFEEAFAVINKHRILI